MNINKPFSGIPDVMKLTTRLDDSGLFVMEDGTIIDQLDVYSDGSVHIAELDSEYTVWDEDDFDIDPDVARHILDKVGQFFSKPYQDTADSETGRWRLELTNSLGDVFKFEGAVSNTLTELSDYIRYWLGQEVDEEDFDEFDELLCFDGGTNNDSVTGLSLIYRWTTSGDPVTPDFCLEESLTIDGDAHIVRHVWKPMNGICVTREYFIRDAVSEFLDSIDVEIFYDPIPGDPPNVVPDLRDRSEYELSVSFRKCVPMYFKGAYDKNNLPPRWGEFIDNLLEFLRYYADTDVFDNRVYNSRKRCTDDLIFISVEFEPDGQTYYYVTDDDSIVPGDTVIVPVGRNWAEKTVKVVNKEYFSREHAPIPLDRVKPILRKADAE